MITAHRGWRWSLWSEAFRAVHRVQAIGALDRVHRVITYWSVPSDPPRRCSRRGRQPVWGRSSRPPRRGPPVLAKPLRRHAINEGREHGRLVPTEPARSSVSAEAHLYGTSVGGRHGRPWIGSCGCGFRRRHGVRCFRVRTREHSGRTAGATPPRSRSGPPSTGSGQRLVSALADASGGYGGRSPVPPGPDTAGASMRSRWDHRPRRDCGRAGDLGTEVPRAIGERRRRAQPDLGSCADDGWATGRGKEASARSGRLRRNVEATTAFASTSDHVPAAAPTRDLKPHRSTPFRVTNDVTPSPLPAAPSVPEAAKPHPISHDVLAAGALLG
jgi:hypothetical protein